MDIHLLAGDAVGDDEVAFPMIPNMEQVELHENFIRTIENHKVSEARAREEAAYFVEQCKEKARKTLESENEERHRQNKLNILRLFIPVAVASIAALMHIIKFLPSLWLLVFLMCIACSYMLIMEIISNYRKCRSKPVVIYPEWLMLKLIELEYYPPPFAYSHFLVTNVMRRSYSVGCLKEASSYNYVPRRTRRNSTGENNFLEYSHFAAYRKKLKKSLQMSFS